MTGPRNPQGNVPPLVAGALTVAGGILILVLAWVLLSFILNHPVLLVFLLIVAVFAFAGAAFWLFKT
jgi:hypothetical protein